MIFKWIVHTKKNKYRKKNKKSNSKVIQSQTHSTSEKPKKIKNIKNNKKNNTLKGGNPNDDLMTATELIEQAFQNDKADSI